MEIDIKTNNCLSTAYLLFRVVEQDALDNYINQAKNHSYHAGIKEGYKLSDKEYPHTENLREISEEVLEARDNYMKLRNQLNIFITYLLNNVKEVK